MPESVQRCRDEGAVNMKRKGCPLPPTYLECFWPAMGYFAAVMAFLAGLILIVKFICGA